jgi:DNA polymerase-3 subunit gamma/tau
MSATPDAIATIARAADGSMRDALSLADQVIAVSGSVTPEAVRDALGLVPEDEYVAILDMLIERRAADVFPLVKRLADAGIDFSIFLAGLADVIRAQLAIVLGGESGESSPLLRDALRERAARFSASDLLRMLNAITAIEPTFRKSAQQQLLVEMLLVRFALLDRAVAIEDLLQSLTDEQDSQPAIGQSGASSSTSRTGSSSSPSPSPSPAAAPSPSRERPRESAQSGSGSASPRTKAEQERWAAEPAGERITPEALRRERVESIRKRSPFMDAAIDALDLELIE